MATIYKRKWNTKSLIPYFRETVWSFAVTTKRRRFLGEKKLKGDLERKLSLSVDLGFPLPEDSDDIASPWVLYFVNRWLEGIRRDTRFRYLARRNSIKERRWTRRHIGRELWLYFLLCLFYVYLPRVLI